MPSLSIVRGPTDAGRALARRLEPWRRDRPFVLAIPRRGVLLGDTVARALQAPLDVLLASHVVAGPAHEAIGAVAEGGGRVLEDAAIAAIQLARPEAERLLDVAETRLARMLARVRGGWPLPELADRTVVIVDDAVISGLTMRAAVAAIRSRGARKIVIAAPLAASSVAERLTEVHDAIFLETMPFADAAREHQARARETVPSDADLHDLIVRELRDVGADPFHGIWLDGT